MPDGKPSKDVIILMILRFILMLFASGVISVKDGLNLGKQAIDENKDLMT